MAKQKSTRREEAARAFIEKTKDKTVVMMNEIYETVIDDFGGLLSSIFSDNPELDFGPYIEKMREDFAKDYVRETYYEEVRSRIEKESK